MKPIYVVVLILIVIVALFAVGIGVGAGSSRGGGSKSNTDSSLAKTMQRWFGGSMAIPLQDLSASCLVQAEPAFVVPAGACNVEVRGSRTNVRMLELKRVSPGVASVTWSPRDSDAIGFEAELKQDKPLRLTVRPKGGTLVLTAVPPQGVPSVRIAIAR